MSFPTRLGPVMLDLHGTSLLPEEHELLRHPASGGIILFSRNYADPLQLAELIATLRQIRPTLLIAVDHEGGRVQRFRQGFTHLPAAARYATFPLEQAITCAETAGWLMAAELRALDVDFSFAPVADVDSGVSSVIGDRAFSQDPLAVADLALAFWRGMGRAGMAGVAKHFPGHGGVAPDSHHALPEDARTLVELLERDLLPFEKLVNAGIEAVMPAHVVYANMDPRPAGFSPWWVGEMLRKRLGFRGAVISDDLSMGGASAFASDPLERAHLARDAGCDLLLVCNDRDAAGRVLEGLEKSPAPSEPQRLENLRGKTAPNWETLHQTTAWQEASRAIEELAHGN